MPHDHSHDHDHDHDHDHGRDDHAHDHDHGGLGHHHHHGPARHDAAFALGVSLNAALVAAQLAVGWIAGSIALMADAVHNLGDVAGLLLAWGAAVLGRRRPTAGRTYGWRRGTILASLANGMLLTGSIGAIAVEAVRRLIHPGPVEAVPVALVAALGLVVNGATALLFMRGREHDLNLRGAFVHMAGDAVLSAGVVAAALLIHFTGQTWLDPAVSLVIAAVIGASTWRLMVESFGLAMDAVPPGLDAAQIEAYLAGLPGVAEVHDLHVWALSTTENAVTAHLVQPEAALRETLVMTAVTGLKDRFGIGHATIQVESVGCAGCALAGA